MGYHLGWKTAIGDWFRDTMFRSYCWWERGISDQDFRPLTGRDYQRSVLLQPNFRTFPESLLGVKQPNLWGPAPEKSHRNSALPSFLPFCEVRLLMHAHPGDEFLSCDWGTSTFRIRWISKGEIAQEYADAIGCKAIFAANSENQTARAEAFENQLNKALATFDRISNPLPLVISGMASSTIGWRELPYAPLPLKLDGSNLRIECIAWKHPALISQIYLVSGAASENEMMRGEESEAIGLLNSISSPPTSLLILPGTHSKHLSIASSQITSIRTFMTGELYDLITTQSVLRASVNPSTTQDLNAFNEGMHCVIERGLSGALFQTRTRQV
ncbi:MAG: 2-dehydro-3-deoxygalactonokinase, partial [Limisphaerales bacterium]